MKLFHGTAIIAILLLAITGLFAQQYTPANASGTYLMPSIEAGSSTATATDALVSSSANIDQLQAQVNDFQITGKTDKVELYGLQKQLAQARSEYYSLLAVFSPDNAVRYRITAWHFRQAAYAFAQKEYGAMQIVVIKPHCTGRIALQ